MPHKGFCSLLIWIDVIPTIQQCHSWLTIMSIPLPAIDACKRNLNQFLSPQSYWNSTVNSNHDKVWQDLLKNISLDFVDS